MGPEHKPEPLDEAETMTERDLSGRIADMERQKTAAWRSSNMDDKEYFEREAERLTRIRERRFGI